MDAATVSHRRHRPLLGIALKVGSLVLFAGMTLFVKLLGQDIPVGQTICLRGLLSAIVLASLAWRMQALHLLKTRDVRSHAVRSLSGAVAMFCLYSAVTMIPLADVTAISFTAPMFITVLAMLFLGEHIHRFRWTALVLGFIGVLIMLGPHLSFAESSTAGALLALASAMFSAVAMIFLRLMSGQEHAITITFYFSLTVMVCGAATALGGWPMPTPTQWVFMILAGLFAVAGQLTMTYAYRYAEASTMAPLDYTSIVMSVLLGYWFFGEIPGLSIWIGTPLVVGSGLIILWREYYLKKQLSTAATAQQ